MLFCENWLPKYKCGRFGKGNRSERKIYRTLSVTLFFPGKMFLVMRKLKFKIYPEMDFSTRSLEQYQKVSDERYSASKLAVVVFL